MKKLKEELKYSKKGITLISLVVTIIILLILAGVTIATLTGDNGLLNRASEAKENTQIASEDELRNLTILEATTHLEEYEYEDSSGAKITIPAKCAVSKVEGENIIQNGLVIIDSNGNEWVWIEVPKEITKQANTDSEIEIALEEYTKNVITDKNGYEDIWYAYDRGNVITSDLEGLTETQKNLNNGCGLTYNEYNEKKSLMLNSIKLNGGFYVGRYEVGYEINQGESTRNYGTDYTTNHPTEQTPAIKPNLYPYNWVRCVQAEELAEKLAVENKTSSLLFGIQWDLIIKFINAKNAKTLEELTLDSSRWANYTKSKLQITNKYSKYSEDNGAIYNNWIEPTKLENESSILTTGGTINTMVLNIYDLAGNMWERTLEKSPVSYNLCTVSGGSFRTTQMYSVSTRSNDGITYSTYDTGFRATLY